MVHKADGALFQRSTRTEADKESGLAPAQSCTPLPLSALA